MRAAQRGDGRRIRFAVDALAAEMALKGGHHRSGLSVVDAGEFDAVAVEREHRLQRADRRPLLPRADERAADDRSGVGPMADAGARENVPGEFLAGIALARGRDVGMGENAFGANRAPRGDVAT
jgi:hypothetical protein